MSERFQNREGQPVPRVDFKVLRDGSLETRTYADVFEGRSVIVFALPGAHLPRYNELAPAFFAAGIDEILCLSVNDAFVMDAWAREQQAENVSFLADGNGEFTAGMGLLVDKSDLGFGRRSWRYSMLVRDGIVEKQFIEPDQPGDPYEVSDADTMLRYLQPEHAEAPPAMTLFTKPGCGHCARAKRALRERGMAFEEVELHAGISATTLRAVAGRTSTPQVFVDGRHVGGADELEAYLQQRDAAASAA